MLASHYAPRAPLSLKSPGDEWPNTPDALFLAFQELPEGAPVGSEILAPTGDLHEAAHHMFAALRRLMPCSRSALLLTKFRMKDLVSQ